MKPREFAETKASQLFSQWKSDVLKSHNPTLRPKSDEELLEIGYKHGLAEYEKLKKQNEILTHALKMLSLEARGFLSMADKYNHGNTNMQVLQHWIDNANEALTTTAEGEE